MRNVAPVLVAILPSARGGVVLVVAIGIALWLLFEFTARKRRSLRTWVVDGIVAGIVFAIVAVLPLEAHARIASLGLGFIVFAPVFVLAIYVCSWWTIRRYRQTLMRREDAREAEDVELPPTLEPGRSEFLDRGFRDVACVRLSGGSVFLFLHRPEDGAIAEIVSYGPPADPSPVYEVTSVLADRTGALATPRPASAQRSGRVSSDRCSRVPTRRTSSDVTSEVSSTYGNKASKPMSCERTRCSTSARRCSSGGRRPSRLLATRNCGVSSSVCGRDVIPRSDS
jgi:hypothetical protein